MPAISATIIGHDALMAKFTSRQAVVVGNLGNEMLRQMAKLAGYVATSKLSGQVLKTRTGTLRRSIHGSETTTGTVVSGQVGTNVKYAKWFENTGTKPHIIRAKPGGALAFNYNGETIFRKLVHHPGFAPKPFLRPSLEEKRADILRALTANVMQSMESP